MRRAIGRRMRAGLMATLILASGLLLTPSPVSAEPESSGSRHVLVLCSFHPSYLWTASMLRGIREALTRVDLPVEPHVKFMDLKRIPASEAYLARFRELLATAYRGYHFDALMACDNDAFAFLRKYRDELFPGVPLVFVSINDFADAMLEGRRDLTGTSESTDYLGTIELALTLRPQAHTVVLVTDETTTGRAHRAAVERLRPKLPHGAVLRVLSLGDYTLEGLGDALAALGDDSVVVLAHHFVDRDGRSHPVDTSAPYLTGRCPVPCFVLSDTRLGLGPLGGRVVSAFHHGRVAAGMVADILHGRDAGSIPVDVHGPNRTMIDHAAMRRFGLTDDDLPTGCDILGAPPAVLTSLRRHLATLGVVLALALVFLTLQALEIRRRRSIERQLRESEERLRRVVLDSPSPTLLHAEDGAILQISRSWYEMTGYTADEIRTIQDWTELAYGERKGPVLAGIDALYALDRSKHEGDFTIRIKDGTTRVWEFSSAPLGRLPDGRRLVMSLAQDVTDRRKAEEALRVSEARLRAVLDATPFPVAIVDLQDQNITYWSRTAQERFGHTAPTTPEWYELAYPDPDYRRDVIARWKPFLEFARTTGAPVNTGEYRVTCHDGSVRTCELWATFLADSLIVTFNDITRRKKAQEEQASLQAQLLQSQKMETVGRLAGGVAHDFNNLLTTITGCAELTRDALAPGSPERQDVEEILRAAERAAALTHQLLAFSRKQLLIVRVFPLAEAVRGMEPMLRRLIGEDIELTLALLPSAGAVRADFHQLEQVIMNLVVNARQAMPSGGKLTVETSDVSLDAAYCAAHPEVTPGRYACLSVTDNGCGIPPDVLAHIFEPFFTTKPVGEGTGLGLAMIDGTVRQHGGHVTAYSEPGKGSTFRVYLPLVEPVEAVAPSTVAPPAQETTTGTETILVVEDEEILLKLARRCLEAQGYTVLTALSPTEALAKARDHQGRIDLLLTDVVMPGMSGLDLAEALSANQRNLRTLFMSGYTGDAIVQHGVLAEGIPFLSKPFTASALALKVRQVLDGAPPRTPAGPD